MGDDIMSGTSLFWAIVLIVIGAGMYIYADGEQIELQHTLGAWLWSGYPDRMSDLQLYKNLGICIAGGGVVLGVAGALDRDPPKT
jgi:hypothetical protein